MGWIPLPVGVENFEDLIQTGYYFVDKTLFIRELIDMKGKVNLFTRPRRFGKTLNMSMLRYFFEMGKADNAELFQGMKIMDAGEEYLAHMGKYPVISISLKSMKQLTYDDAFYCLQEELAREFKRHDELLPRLLYEEDREKYLRFIGRKAETKEYLDSLKFLSECLFQCYGRKAIILIDEYDVPLENAYFSGFYDKMVSVIRALFESALKTNDNLEFAVITGCLRISKESIFTGLNNLKIMSITSRTYAEHFGFTPEEVEQILRDYGLEDNLKIVKQWYDGYRFGESEVYNPWSVINYVDSCYHDKKAFARMVERYVALAYINDPQVKDSASLPAFAYPQLKLQAPAPELLTKLGLEAEQQRPWLALGCGANYGPAKLWPVEFFAQVSAHFITQRGFAVLALGSNKDHDTVEQIKAATSN